jgi:hypothetical protein
VAGTRTAIAARRDGANVRTNRKQLGETLPMTRTRVFFALAPMLALVGISGCAPDHGVGHVAVAVRGLTEAGSITGVTVESGGTTATLAFDSAKGGYSGSLALPVGPQHLTVKAFAGTTVAGLGTADVNITVNTTTTVSVSVLDVTGGQTHVAAGPYITALTSSSTSAVVNQSLTLTVSALDAENNTLSYAWTSSCANSTFGAPTAATTSWQASATGSCRLTVTVTAKNLTDTQSLELFVFEAGNDKGAAAIDATYVPSPSIVYVQVTGTSTTGSPLTCAIYGSDNDSMCRTPFAAANAMQVYIGFNGDNTATLTDSCGGTITPFSSTSFQYTPVKGLCTLTGTVTNSHNLNSSLSASIFTK